MGQIELLSITEQGALAHCIKGLITGQIHLNSKPSLASSNHPNSMVSFVSEQAIYTLIAGAVTIYTLIAGAVSHTDAFD